MSKAIVEVAAGTRRGAGSLVNEDAIGINGWAMRSEDPLTFPFGKANLLMQPEAGSPCVFVVSDGVGGRAGSQEASLLVAAEASKPIHSSGGPHALFEALRALHDRLLEMQLEQPLFSDLGATLVGAAVMPSGQTVCFSVGDSRMYSMNAGSLVTVSRDDSEPVPFTSQLRLGKWLGQRESDLGTPWAGVLAQAETQRCLLCSDGVYREVGEQTLEGIMGREELSPRETVGEIFKWLENPADDATAIVLKVSMRDEITPPKSADGGRNLRSLLPFSAPRR